MRVWCVLGSRFFGCKTGSASHNLRSLRSYMSAWRHPQCSGALVRENDSPRSRRRVHAAPARRERVVYPGDGNCDAVAALSALIAPDHQLTAPDVQVLPADASPALEAALWAASAPRGNRDLQRGRQKVRSRIKPPPINTCQRAGRARAARDDRARLRRARRRLRRGLRAAPESLATFDGRRSPSAFTAVSAGRASPAVSEPAPPTPPKEREKRDSLLCDGDTVDAVLGSVFD